VLFPSRFRFTLIVLAAQLTLATPLPKQLDFNMDNWFATESTPCTGSFSSGVNGRSGNANTMDINFNLLANRETSVNTTNFIGNYFFGRNNSTTVNDRAFGQIRRERKINELWSIYFQGALDEDSKADITRSLDQKIKTKVDVYPELSPVGETGRERQPAGN
jgi:hypothetical protein